MKDLIKGLNENRVSNSLVWFFDTYMLTNDVVKRLLCSQDLWREKSILKFWGCLFDNSIYDFWYLGDCEGLWASCIMVVLIFFPCFGRQVKEFFGAGTACVVSPVEKILYKSQWLDIPTMSKGAPLTMRMYNTLLDIQVIHFILSHTFIANHAVSSRLEYR